MPIADIFDDQKSYESKRSAWLQQATKTDSKINDVALLFTLSVWLVNVSMAVWFSLVFEANSLGTVLFVLLVFLGSIISSIVLSVIIHGLKQPIITHNAFQALQIHKEMERRREYTPAVDESTGILAQGAASTASDERAPSAPTDHKSSEETLSVD